jgi:predicted phage terminase large subunit-like protein
MLRPGERNALRAWEDHLLGIRRATPVDQNESPRVREERVARLKGDFKAFSEYYFPHYCTAPFAKFQLKQQRAVMNTPRGVFCWVIARAHAKSVIHTILNPLFLAVNGELRTMLLTSYSETNAITLLSDLQAELEANQRLIQDFGSFKGLGDWEQGRFITQQGWFFVAIGSGQSPRGVRNEPVRPDYIVADDFDEDEQSRNPKRVDEAEKWLRGALFGAMDITGRGRFVMVGNRFAKDMVLARVYEIADHRMTVNILDDNGKPSWPERYTVKECQFMIEKMGYNVAQREYFNNPIQEGKTFQREWLVSKKLPPLKTYRALVAYLDPGFKKTSTSDSKAWILVGLHNAEYHVVKAYVGVATVNEMIGWGYELQAYVQQHGGAVRMRMEEVFLQDLLYQDFAAEAAKRGAPLPLQGDKRKKPEKDARIEAISGHFERGNVYFNAAMDEDHHMKRLKEQLLNFQPGVKTHKDGPDALEGAIHDLQSTVTTAADITIGDRHKSKYRL